MVSRIFSSKSREKPLEIHITDNDPEKQSERREGLETTSQGLQN